MSHLIDFLSKSKITLDEASAKSLDEAEGDQSLRHEFRIPTLAQLKGADVTNRAQSGDGESTYLCGNSLGVQPKRTRDYIDRYLNTWSSQGVYGHFKNAKGAVTQPWVHIDEQASAAMASIVGAHASEVAVMETLTANLHLLMSSFYQPTKDKFKILIEGKAFPSDHFAVQSHLAQRGYAAREALVLLEPSDVDKHYFSTEHILATIDQHADSLALILLPGIQFYTGQLLDIKTITAHAHSRKILIGWDLAHAAGNVVLQLHDWNVDFAAWCTYKYLNSGPGCIGALFVHERHSHVESPDAVIGDDSSNSNNSSDKPASSSAAAALHDNDILASSLEAQRAFRFRPRLCGWWGSSKASRFDMTNVFVPLPGAAGWQLSNPSALDTTSVLASLSVFGMTSMPALRARSLRLTAYLEYLLLHWPSRGDSDGNDANDRPYVLLTPSDPEQRGAQISVRFRPGLLEGVMADLEEAGVVLDERKPDVIRIAPAPLYNTFHDVWTCVSVLWMSLEKRQK